MKTLTVCFLLLGTVGCFKSAAPPAPPTKAPAQVAPSPPPPAAAPAHLPEQANRQGEADTPPEFAGLYESEDGSKNSKIENLDGGCLIEHREPEGLVKAPGLVLGHYLGSCYSKDGKGRFSAYVIDGSGNLKGKMATLQGDHLQISDDDLNGPAFPKDEEQFAQYQGGQYGDVNIKKTGENSLELTRADGSKGFGFRMDKWLWVGWDGALCVYQFPANSLTDLQCNFLAAAGEEPQEWPLMKLKKGEEAQAVDAKIEGEEAVAANPVNPPVPGDGVALPAKGPHLSPEAARAQLRQDMQAKIDEFLNYHNQVRAEVGVGPLQWDPKLAAYAQEWADHLAAAPGGQLDHRPNGKYGENLAWYPGDDGSRPVHGASLWYGEKKDFIDDKAQSDHNIDKAGHYTQMIWKQTTKVGFGLAMGRDGMVFLCANYEKPGNMMGEHPFR